MKKVVIILVLFGILFSLNLLSASYRVGNLSHIISTAYSKGDFISGWVNMSFDHELSDSLFETNSGDSIKLIDLINANSGTEHYNSFCIPSDCSNSYTLVPNSAGLGKSFVINSGQERVFGMRIFGTNLEGIDVTKFSLGVSSTAGESDVEQLSISILNNEQAVWKNSMASGNFGTKNSGCYTDPGTPVPITTDEYCEQIELPAAPNVRLGAGIIANTGAVQQTFTLSIVDRDGNFGSCSTTASTSGQINCIAKADGSDFKTEQKTYFVCLSGSSSDTKYSISYEQTTPICGISNGIPDFDFNVSAEAGTFATIGSLVIDNTSVPDIESYIATYLLDTYGTGCPATEGCIISIKFSSNVNQQITLSNAVLSYTAGIPKTNNTLYNLTETPALVNASMQKLYLDSAEFSAPSKSGEFSLSYKDNKIFSENINIRQLAAISLNPTTTIAGYPTNFSIRFENSVPANTTITYTWDFGDETLETSTGKSMVHTYSAIGIFELVVEVSYRNITASKSFEIEVKTPKEAVNAILSEKIKNLDNITASIRTFPIFYQKSLNVSLDLKDWGTQLKDLQLKNASAKTDDDYIEIMTELIELKIPSSIKTTSRAQGLSFFADENKIDLDILKSIKSFTLQGSSDEYATAIMAWNLENMDTKISLEKISALYGSYSEPVLSVITINAKKKTFSDYNPYLIIQKSGIIDFMDDYSFEETDDYYYKELEDEEIKIVFSTAENLDFTSLPVFISPVLEKLSIINITEEGKPRIWILILSLGLLVAFGIGVFLLMQNWYRKKYEDFLFKNKNDLYNLVAYIQNSKKAGIKDNEISSKLKKGGWKAEQVTYVMKKYAGKRIPGILGKK